MTSSLGALDVELYSDIVRSALSEDLGQGDKTTKATIETGQRGCGELRTKEWCVLAGVDIAVEVFRQIDRTVLVTNKKPDGHECSSGDLIVALEGRADALLTAERTALNFLQLLSGTATLARQYASLTTGSEVKILDTRKTIPGLRLAQKYAVAVGGCNNHRIGLYDAFLIKENHIAACGGIALAVAKAREIAPEKVVEVEVENLDELNEALDAQADVEMLDNFSPSDIDNLNHLNFGETKIEVSGNITDETVKHYINSAVDYISSGSLTKHVQATDLSMRLI